MNIDTLLIHYCAPTLARMKMGALLCFHRRGTIEEFQETVEKYNRRFNEKKLYFRILFSCPMYTDRLWSNPIYSKRVFPAFCGNTATEAA